MSFALPSLFCLAMGCVCPAFLNKKNS